MSNRNGFSLLELIVVIVIVGILSSLTIFGISSYLQEKKGEREIVSLWTQLTSVRARAIRNNCPYLVVLDTANSTYNIYEDSNKNYSVDSSSEYKNINILGNNDLKYGVADGTIPSIEGYNPNSGNIQGTWASDTLVSPTVSNTIVYKSDEIGSISNGAIFMQNRYSENIGYAIIKSGAMFILWKWNGSKWYEM